jgi:hypothetical protein
LTKRYANSKQTSTPIWTIAHPGAVSLVQLGNKMMPTAFGLTPRPEFKIVGWRDKNNTTAQLTHAPQKGLPKVPHGKVPATPQYRDAAGYQCRSPAALGARSRREARPRHHRQRIAQAQFDFFGAAAPADPRSRTEAVGIGCGS